MSQPRPDKPDGTASDEAFMARAIDLAKRGGGWVNPNPQVGCVIVSQSGEVIGEGYHTRFGHPHAEREALADCARRGNSPKGATVYVTLEPCAHQGKTPPCADALVEACVGHVVVGSEDPNPLVAGRGITCLEEAGIPVTQGLMKDACDALNAPFFHYLRTGRPYVVAKWAMTLDGKIATRTGKSRWITGPEARRKVHEDRSRYAGIMVGVNTVITDDPLLNVRLDNGLVPHQPTRIVADTTLRMPLDSKLVKTARDIPVVVLTGIANPERHAPYVEAGCTILVCQAPNGHLDLTDALRLLGSAGLDSVLVEGGPTLLGSLVDAGLVDHVMAYIAPKVFADVDDPADASLIHRLTCTPIGDDFLLEGDLS